MEKEEIINMDELDPPFTCEITSQSGRERTMMCVQCTICSSGCPVASGSGFGKERRENPGLLRTESIAVCSFIDNHVLTKVEAFFEVM